MTDYKNVPISVKEVTMRITLRLYPSETSMHANEKINCVKKYLENFPFKQSFDVWTEETEKKYYDSLSVFQDNNYDGNADGDERKNMLDKYNKKRSVWFDALTNSSTHNE